MLGGVRAGAWGLRRVPGLVEWEAHGLPATSTGISPFGRHDIWGGGNRILNHTRANSKLDVIDICGIMVTAVYTR